MMPRMRTLHKWIGLIIAIQFVLWMASGVVMSLLDADKVRASALRAKPPAVRLWPADTMPLDAILAASTREATTISSAWLLELPVYQLASAKATWMVRAVDGQPVALDAGLAARIAQASYAGRAKAAPARLLSYTVETRRHKEHVWRVDFHDAEETTVYVSDKTGNVLEHRNSTWRLFDFFWMLHIMDYAERADFNNSLLITSAIGGLVMALSGVWLLFASFSLAEMIPSRLRRRRTVKVYTQDGSLAHRVAAAKGDTLLQALARNGLQLPSNCGGGQRCGLCQVRCIGRAPPASPAERALLSPQKLAAGYRLACNVRVDASVDIEAAQVAKLSS